jgi:hypothetical protein
MEDKDRARLIMDGIKQGFLTVQWNSPRRRMIQSIHSLIKNGQDKGFLVEVCSGCGAPTKGRDCGCPTGTSLRWNEEKK